MVLVGNQTLFLQTIAMGLECDVQSEASIKQPADQIFPSVLRRTLMMLQFLQLCLNSNLVAVSAAAKTPSLCKDNFQITLSTNVFLLFYNSKQSIAKSLFLV